MIEKLRSNYHGTIEDGVLLSKLVAYTSKYVNYFYSIVLLYNFKELFKAHSCVEKAGNIAMVEIVDAAHAGNTFICEEFRPLMNGLEDF